MASLRFLLACVAAVDFLLASSLALAQAQPQVRAVDSEYLAQRAAREQADRRATRKYYLSLSRITVAPERPSSQETVVATVNIVAQGLPSGQCPNPAGVSAERTANAVRLAYPVMPCANSLAVGHVPVEVNLGRLEPGQYTLELDVPNDLGLDPVKSVTLQVSPVSNDEEALMIAVRESAADVAHWLGRRKFSQERLDTALNHACRSGYRNSDDPATVRILIAAGANPNSAIHQAAQAAPRCLAELIAAKGDVNLDIAKVAGILLSYTGEGPRFRIGREGPPLLYAVRALNVETVRVLLAAGADPNLAFAVGRSPYAETFSLELSPADSRMLAIRQQMEAKGGSRTLAQRALSSAQQAEGAVKGGAFFGICWLSVAFGGKCH